jgi:hypothetical protein
VLIAGKDNYFDLPSKQTAVVRKFLTEPTAPCTVFVSEFVRDLVFESGLQTLDTAERRVPQVGLLRAMVEANMILARERLVA